MAALALVAVLVLAASAAATTVSTGGEDPAAADDDLAGPPEDAAAGPEEAGGSEDGAIDGTAGGDERELPAPAELVRETVTARAGPSQDAEPVARFRQFRDDFRPTLLRVEASQRDADGREWLRVDVPGRPNGRHGWVPAAALDVLEAPAVEIVIRRGSRRLEAWRGEELLLRTRVAVGKAGAETPLGSFYVTAEFRPALHVLGVYAFETSAYSTLSDWPGGGIVGIHGTYQPELLGQAVSHGCVRVANAAILRLRRLVEPGTVVRIVR